MSGSDGIVLPSRATPRAHRHFRGADHDRAHPWDEPTRPALHLPDGRPAAGAAGTSAGTAAGTVPGGVALADDPQPKAAGGRKRTGLLIGGVAARRSSSAAPASFAFQSAERGGSQPADVLPGDSYAYLRLDIDPSRRPEDRRRALPRQAPPGQGHPRQRRPSQEALGDGLQGLRNDCVAKVNYDNDIAPWLGDRVGAAIRPGGTEDTPNVAIAIQVKDEGAAKDTLTKLFACDKSGDTDLRMKDGYAIITPAGDGDATLAAVDKGSLAQNATFTGDMAALGEQGVVSAWFDMGTGGQGDPEAGWDSRPAAPSTTSRRRQGPRRLRAALRPGLRRDGRHRPRRRRDQEGQGRRQRAGQPAGQDTVGALQVSGADQMLDAAWPQLVKKQIEGLAAARRARPTRSGQIEQQLDVKLPDDLKVLLGRSFTIAMPDQEFDDDVPTFGAKVVTTDVKRAESSSAEIEEAAGGDQRHADAQGRGRQGLRRDDARTTPTSS